MKFYGGADKNTNMPIYVTRPHGADKVTGQLSMPLGQVLSMFLFAFVVAWLWLIVAFVYGWVVMYRLIF